MEFLFKHEIKKGRSLYETCLCILFCIVEKAPTLILVWLNGIRLGFYFTQNPIFGL